MVSSILEILYIRPCNASKLRFEGHHGLLIFVVTMLGVFMFCGLIILFLFGSGGVKALVIFPHQYIGPGEVLSSLRHKAFISLKLFLIIDFEIQLYANDSNDIFERVGCHTKNRVSI